jgi:hypothetical protein
VLAALNVAIATPLPFPSRHRERRPRDAAAANLTWLSGGIVDATSADIERAWIAGPRQYAGSRRAIGLDGSHDVAAATVMESARRVQGGRRAR